MPGSYGDGRVSPQGSLKHDDCKPTAVALETMPSILQGTVLEDGDPVDVDATHLATLGYKQELKRALGLMGILSSECSPAGRCESADEDALSFAILSVPSGMFTTLNYGLVAGGPTALLYKCALSLKPHRVPTDPSTPHDQLDTGHLYDTQCHYLPCRDLLGLPVRCHPSDAVDC